jgi:acetylornithine deacetylase
MTALEWLDRLIAFDTTSQQSNMHLIESVWDWMSRHGAACHMIHDPSEPKANLFATLPAASGRMDGGLILSGHTDVVPVEGQLWKTKPFEMTTMEGRVYGRGTSDMKGFLAVALSLVPRFKAMQLNYPLHFAFSYDEEIGCRGAPFMIADLPKTDYKPRACIVGEPTEMLPIVAHKGKQSFRCEIHGRAAHSSLTPQGCNAIEHAARLICFLSDLAESYRQKGPFDESYDVPYTTLATTLIKGGNASNIIPALCEFVFEFRHLSENTPSSIENKITAFIENDLVPRMRLDFEEAYITLDKFAGAPGLSHVEDADIVQLVRAVTEDYETRKAAYATEAGLYQQADIPTVLCGPGSIEQAHRPDEYVALEQLERCEQFLQDVVRKFNES